jgi:hypothetical protein
MSALDWLQEYLGAVVVCDLADAYLIIGTLSAVGPQHVSFTDADLHDHRESNSPKDVYLIESRKFGVRANRKQVAVPRQLVIAVSRLDDIVTT